MKKHNLLVILLLLFSRYALAYQPTAAELHQNPALCSYGYNSNCGSSSSYSSPKVNVVHLPDKYGAISVGILKGIKTYFSISNEYSAGAAERKALEKCRHEDADRCSIATRYANQCVGSTMGIKNKLYTTYFGFGLSPNIASNDALEKCKSDNAEQCHLFAEVECSL